MVLDDHGQSAAGCVAQKKIRSNTEYWLPKLARNKVRDERAQAALTAAGWRVFVIWECRVGNEAGLRQLVRQLKASHPSARSKALRPRATPRRQAAARG